MAEVENSKETQNAKPKNSRVGFFQKVFKLPRQLNGLDKYVIFAFTSLIVFTGIILFLFYLTNEEPSTLVACYFAAFGGEVLCCAMIKKFKLDKQFRGGDSNGDNSSC